MTSRGQERLVAELFRKSGLIVNEDPPSISCHSPVENRQGKPIKTTTKPDLYVLDPITGCYFYIEVTRNGGKWPSKAAQQRVITQAEIERGEKIPYLVITREKVGQMLALLYLSELLGWQKMEVFPQTR